MAYSNVQNKATLNTQVNSPLRMLSFTEHVLIIINHKSTYSCSQGARWSRDSRLLEWIFTSWACLLIIYHTHKNVLCWDFNNLIKKNYENAIVWGEIRTEKWIVYI